MKNPSSRRFLVRLAAHRGRRQLAFAAALALLLGSHSVQAASGTWLNTGTNPIWSDAGNWVGGGVPGTNVGVATTGTNQDVATFNTATGTVGTSINPITIDTGRNLGSIRFDTNTGSYNFGGGGTVILSNPPSISMLGTIAGSNLTESFAGVTLSLGGGSTFTNSTTQAQNDLLVLGNLTGNSQNSSQNWTFAGTGNINLTGNLTTGTSTNISTSFTNTGTVNVSGANTYTGSTTVSAGAVNFLGASTLTGATAVNGGTLTFAGAAGANTGASAYTLNSGRLVLDNTTAAGGNNNARIADTSALTLGGGNFLYRGTDAAGTNSTETVGAIAEGQNSSVLTLTYGGTNTATVTATNLSHAAGTAVSLVNGANLGQDSASTASVSRLILTTAPTLTGTTVAAAAGINSGAKDTKIVPYLVGEATSTTGGASTATGTANTFLTYNATTGLRPLNPTDEFTNNAITAGNNTYITGATTAGTTAAINSLVINGGDLSIADGAVLTNTSGALLFASSNAIKPAGTTGALTFANNTEGQVYVNSGATGTISAAITATGTNALTKSGAGTLVLSGANTYSGTTSVEGGTLQASGTNSSAGGTTLASNSTLSLGTGTNGGLASGTITANGGGVGTASTITNTSGSPVTLSNSLTINNNLNNTSVIFTGTSPITINGGLLINNTSGFNGLTNNASATLTFGAANPFNLTKSGDANNRNFTINGSGSTVINGVVAAPNGPGNTGGLTYSGTSAGSLTLNNNNTFNGALSMSSAGTLVLAGSNANVPSVTVTTSSGTIKTGNANSLGAGTLTWNAGVTGTTLSLGAGVTTTAANALSFNQNSVHAEAITLDAPAPQAGYTQTFGAATFGQQGVLTLNQTGNLTSPGTIAFGASTFGNGTASGKLTTINPMGVNVTIASITAVTSASATNTLVLDGTSTGNTIGAIANTDATHQGALIKSNTSTWTLLSANTYSGATAITGGKLLLSNTTGSATGTGAVSIGTAGTLASGAGNTPSVAGLVTTAGAGSTIAPGATAVSNTGTVGMLTLTGGLNVALGATIPFDLSSSGSDLIKITGGTFTGGTAASSVTFNFTDADLTPAGTYALINWAGVTATGVDLTDFKATGLTGSFSFNGSELDFNIAAVPEPSTWISGLVALGLMGYSQRRRIRDRFVGGC